MPISRRTVVNLIIAFLVLAMVVIIGLKFIIFGYSLESVIPVESYSVRTSMTFTGNGDDLVVRTFLPQTTDRQHVSNEIIVADRLEFNRDSNFDFDRGNWLQYQAEGDYEIDVNYRVTIQPVRYEISPDIKLPESYPESLSPYLEETNDIQVNSPEIMTKTRELVGGEEYLLDVLKVLFDYVHGLGSKPFKGTTDALTALRLGEASCNGKSRLFIAMARSLGIPSRLVGGMILNPGTKRTSHQWLEVFINGYWVPFDTLNDHFAKLPKNYLTLYHGDEVLFRHSRNIGFDYHFDIKKSTVTNSRLPGFINDQSGATFNAIDSLIKGGFSLSILQFLLVIPFAVLFVVFFKNVIGLRTYGTFLPALMAMAIQETGLQAGLLAFVLVLVVTVSVRYPLEKLGLLHTPKLAIMMVAVIFSLLAISILSLNQEWSGLSTLTSAAVFPIAILTITSERIALTISEEGVVASASILFQTLLVVSVCFLLIRSVALQALILVFPELLLGVLAMNMWIGSWTGIRVLEFYRFRLLLFPKDSA